MPLEQLVIAHNLIHKSLRFMCHVHTRLGKLACPRVNDDQKIAVDDKKLNSGRPHDDQLISGYSLIH